MKAICVMSIKMRTLKMSTSTPPPSVEDTLIGRMDLLWNRAGPADASEQPSTHQWRSTIHAAEEAKALMNVDSVRADRAFDDLIAAHRKADGMVYLKRAEAYAAVGHVRAAARDFERAEALLPYPGRKAEARAGLRRTTRRPVLKIART